MYADPLDCATISARQLKELVEVLAEDDQQKVANAVDEMLSRA